MQSNFLIDYLFPAAFIIMLACFAVGGLIFAVTQIRIYFLQKRAYEEYTRITKDIHLLLDKMDLEKNEYKSIITRIANKLGINTEG